MSKKTGILAIVLSVIAICLSLFAIVQVRAAADSDTHDIQYVMYLGTNDKDTNEPVFQPGEAKKEAEETKRRENQREDLTEY